jgi:hypothetical protein
LSKTPIWELKDRAEELREEQRRREGGVTRGIKPTSSKNRPTFIPRRKGGRRKERRRPAAIESAI